MKRITFLAVSLALIICLLVSGCNITLPGNTSQSLDSTKGGILNLYSIDPSTLDPARSSDSTSSEYIMQIFSGLVQLDEQMNVKGDIALNWDISTDGLNYTFYLRQNAKFQDGRSLVSQDIKYSWERAANPATNSQTALTYLGDIVGIKDILEGKTDTASGIKAPDDYTLQVTIDAPKSYFLYKLTYPTAFVVDRKNVSSGSNWWKKPNGSGPFILTSWNQNQSLTLEKNSNYYGEPAKLNQVRYQFYSGNTMDLFETGKIDIAGVSSTYIDAVSDPSGPFYKDMVTSPALSFYYIGLNCSKPPFNDVNIRRAFNLAIDKDKIVSLIYRDMVIKADGILPPGIPGYNEKLVGSGYDIEKAKELIKASQYGDISKLPSITLTTSGYGGDVSPTLEALVYQWKENLGIDVHIRQLEPEEYFYNLKSEMNEMFDMGWIADYPHPQDFLDILFSSGTNNNYGQFSNLKVDALIKQANQESNLEQSYKLYQQAEQLLIEDAACIPLTFDKNYFLIKSYVQGYSVSPMGFAAMNQVSVIPH